MKTKTLMAGILMLASATTATAGGILTNTNQSIDFLRNPARDAAIALDGVYYNPAGVAFLPEGFYLGLNWQYAHQKRTITSTNPVFQLGAKNQGLDTKTFQGVADAPIIPSIHAALNRGNWSYQFNFAVPGGGGKCNFSDGLGSFESVVGSIAQQLQPLGAERYDMNGYMQGRQYYFGFTLGAAYKINDNLSIYGGLRLLYGDATYKAKISNILVKKAGNGYVDFGSFLSEATATVDAGIAQVTAGLQQVAGGLEQVNAGIAQYEAAGATAPAALVEQRTQLLATQQQLTAQQQQLEGSRTNMDKLQKYSQGVNLLCNQTSLGVAPIVGIDYRLGRWNFAAKYELKTQIRMENESTVDQASEIPAVNKFRDDEEVNEDQPALLTLGVQWNPIDPLRASVGWHYYFDKDADWYNNSQQLPGGDNPPIIAKVEKPAQDAKVQTVEPENDNVLPAQPSQPQHQSKLQLHAKPASDYKNNVEHLAQASEMKNDEQLSASDEEIALAALEKFSTVLNKGMDQLENANEKINDINNAIQQHLI